LNWKKGTLGWGGMLALVILIGLMLRTPITTLPLMLGDLARKLDVSKGSLGILTTLPLIMFMLFSSVASTILKKLGFKKSLLLTLTVLLIGSLLRLIVTMPTMIIGTSLIGMGIAYLNVYMPSFVAAYFPNNIGLYTSLYTFAMMFGVALFNIITAPVMLMTGWWSMLVVLVITPLLALGIWLFLMPHLSEEIHEPQVEVQKENVPTEKIWLNKKAWVFLIMFGSQSILNYTFTAWMPSLMAYHHVGTGVVGIIMAGFSLIGLPITVLLPQLLMKWGNFGETILVASAGIAGLIASIMLFFQNTSATWFWMIESLLLGYAIGFFFMFVVTMFAIKTGSPYQTAQLSGMAQAGGYFIAALGPVVYGWAFGQNPAGNLQNVAFVVAILLATIMGLMIVRTKKV
jgi:CP family cyanate transporter-like MFS transporter